LAYQPSASSTFLSEQISHQPAVLFSQNKSAINQQYFSLRTNQPSTSSTFLSEQISHQQPASSIFLSEQISTSHQQPAKRTGLSGEGAPSLLQRICLHAAPSATRPRRQQMSSVE
jgi:hypothetical protein